MRNIQNTRRLPDVFLGLIIAVSMVAIAPEALGEQECDYLDGGCAGGASPPGDPDTILASLANALDAMETALSATVSGETLPARLELAGSVVTETPLWMQVSAPARLASGTTALATGTLVLTVMRNDGDTHLLLQLTEGGVTRTLSQSVWLGTTINLWGFVDDGSSHLSGGYIYDSSSGVIVFPGSDSAFDAGVRTMLHLTTQVAGGGISLATVLNQLGNRIATAINYVRDYFIPYTPPSNCLGPLTGESCDEDDVPCDDIAKSFCDDIHELPGVSTAFKKCMKGRCGCGGSNHKRARMICDSIHPSCGPCGPVPGCSSSGAEYWYCSGNPDDCPCVGTIFHEMSHGCGTQDRGDGSSYDSYRIEEWFEEQCTPVGEEE